MSKRTRAATLATTIVCVATLPAAAVAAPADLPDLASMAVGSADLPAGATVSREGSTSYPGAVAAYARTIQLSRRAGAKAGFIWLQDTVALYDDSASTSAILTGVRRLFRSPAARRSFVRAAAGDLYGSVRRVRVRPPRTVRAGDAAFVVGLTVTVHRVRIREMLAFERVDRVLSVITVAGTGSQRRLMRGTEALLRLSADRMRAGLLPVSLTAPTISGTPAPGTVLSADAGTWRPATAPASLAYQWQRCDAAGQCVLIAGATAPTYTVAPEDSGASLRVAVTGNNPAGQTTAVSDPFGPIG